MKTRVFATVALNRIIAALCGRTSRRSTVGLLALRGLKGVKSRSCARAALHCRFFFILVHLEAECVSLCALERETRRLFGN